MTRFPLALAAALALAGPAAAETLDPRWAVDPATLVPRGGPDDEIGAAALLTPQVALGALSLVERGEVLSLAVPLDRSSPAYGWRRFELLVAQNEGTGLSNNEDFVSGPINTGTQIDGLAHMGVDRVFYGGRRGEDIQAVDGLRALGIENAPPIFTRGLVLDIPGLKGVERLPIGYAVSVADLEAAMARQGIASIRPGDVVLIHTGHRRLLEECDAETFLSGQPGPGVEAAEWLAAHGAVAVGGDNPSLEALPHEDPRRLFPVHQILLARHGVHILENLATERLVEGGWSEFLFVAAPLPITGSSSSWINPIAVR